MKILREGKDITEYISSFEWSGSASQCSRVLSIEVANSPYDKDFKSLNIKTGDTIKMYDDAGKLRFVGGVQERARQGEAGTLPYKAQDYMIHLLRSKATYKFKEKTAEAISKKICLDAKVKPGNLAKTKVKIGKMICEGMGLYDIILAAYRKAAKKTGKKYIVQMDGAKLDVEVKGGIIANYELDPSTSITASHYSESTSEVINKVAIYKKNKRIGTVQSKESVKKYGIFQEALSIEKGKGKTEAKKMLQGISKNANVEAIGDIRAVAGKGVKIKDPGSGLTGVFWIENDTHRFENGVHVMNLALTFKNIMDTPSSSSSSGAGSSGSSPGSGSPAAPSDPSVAPWSGDNSSAPRDNSKGFDVATYALNFRGKVKYVFGTASPNMGTSDCSGFTQYVFSKSAGMAIGRTTNEQLTKGETVDKAIAAPGDLIFFKDTYESGFKRGVSHVGVCVGNKQFCHCGSGGVIVSSMSEVYWALHFLEIRRVLNGE
jgi:cell wall-associated NlpC family hydrolase